MKTIRMPKELLDKWLAALRSGEYKQGTGFLHNREKNTYCCLGVLQHVTTGGTESWPDGTELPPYSWLKERGIVFLDAPGHRDASPWLPTLETDAGEANDSGKTFPEIAVAIEACAEGF